MSIKLTFVNVNKKKSPPVSEPFKMMRFHKQITLEIHLGIIFPSERAQRENFTHLKATQSIFRKGI